MQFGTEKTTTYTDDGAVTEIKHFRFGGVDKALRTHKIIIKVKDSQEEMTEYIRFTKELSEARKNSTLVVDKEDPSTYPSFVIKFPKEDIDGSYFVIKNYSLLIDI